MSQHSLTIFAELQLGRIKRSLISTAPRQTFTAKTQQAEAVDRTPAHRKRYFGTHRAAQPTKEFTQHGTILCYVQAGCRCGPCASANSVYRKDLRSRDESTQRTPAEHGTPVRYRRGCRCPDCIFANWDYGRRWRAAHHQKAHPPNGEAA